MLFLHLGAWPALNPFYACVGLRPFSIRGACDRGQRKSEREVGAVEMTTDSKGNKVIVCDNGTGVSRWR